MDRTEKAIAFLVAICVFWAFTGCNAYLLEKYYPLPDSDSIDYYDSVEEAMIHGSFIDHEGNTIVGELIGLLYGDAYAILFLRPEPRYNRNRVFVYFLYVKKEAGTNMYSSIINRHFIDWEQHKGLCKLAGLSDTGEIRLSIFLYSQSGDWGKELNIDMPQRHVWGFSRTERVKNLAIEGQPVTEVIEIEFDEETVYFWYFDDLATEKSPVFLDEIGNPDYNNGEMVITMD